jgi:predicted AAA+ superfamily ATPase
MLEASGQIVLLEPWFSSRTKSIVKSPKLYLADTGLLCALLNIRSEDALRQSPAVGASGVLRGARCFYPQPSTSEALLTSFAREILQSLWPDPQQPQNRVNE